MENVVLIVHLLLALGIIAAVLLQRSEGGALGIGGGGGTTASRPPIGALGKLTWALGAAFIVTSLTLTIFAAEKAAGVSILDRLGIDSPAPATAPLTPGGNPATAPADTLLPPALPNETLTPPPAD